MLLGRKKENRCYLNKLTCFLVGFPTNMRKDLFDDENERRETCRVAACSC